MNSTCILKPIEGIDLSALEAIKKNFINSIDTNIIRAAYIGQIKQINESVFHYAILLDANQHLAQSLSYNLITSLLYYQIITKKDVECITINCVPPGPHWEGIRKCAIKIFDSTATIKDLS
jgi:hypothetical protein